MLDSIHSLTHENLQLGEGVLLRGVELDAVQASGYPGEALAEAMQDAACLIGATKEGCVFRCVPRMIDLTRGQRTPAAGETLVGRWEVSLSGTLLEVTPENTAMLLNLAQVSSTVIAPVPSPAAASGETICWVGTTGSGLLAIELHGPVSTGGMVLRARRSGMGEMPFTLLAHQNSPADAALPCRLLWMKEASA